MLAKVTQPAVPASPAAPAVAVPAVPVRRALERGLWIAFTGVPCLFSPREPCSTEMRLLRRVAVKTRLGSQMFSMSVLRAVLPLVNTCRSCLAPRLLSSLACHGNTTATPLQTRPESAERNTITNTCCNHCNHVVLCRARDSVFSIWCRWGHGEELNFAPAFQPRSSL